MHLKHIESRNGSHSKLSLRLMGLLGEHNQIILLPIAAANGAQDRFITQILIAIIARHDHLPFRMHRQLIRMLAVTRHGIQ